MKLSEHQRRLAKELFYADRRKDKFFTAGVNNVEQYIETCLFTYGGTKVEALFERAVNLLMSDGD